MEFIERITALSNELESHTIEIRRQIHQNPETAFKENETSALVIRELNRIGIAYEKSPVKPGIIAMVDSGKPGKLLMLRADMDALPIQEDTDVPFRSKNPNVMHACGHDVHTANLLAVGEILNRTKEYFKGRVKLVFQPGEERGGGGRKMIEQGLMDELPDACFGLHVLPVEKGVFKIGTGYLTAYSDGCRIVVHGKATHSSEPQNGVDAINIAASIITSFNTILSKSISPMEYSTFNIGLISGGLAPNIVPDRVELQCMMRNVTPKAREIMKARIQSLASGTAKIMGGSCDVEFNTGYPSVFNHHELTKFAVDVIEKNAALLYSGIDGGNVPDNYMLTGNQIALIAEDFGFYSQKVPSCFVQVGTGAYAAAHNSHFFVDESYIKLCTRAMGAMAGEYLKE